MWNSVLLSVLTAFVVLLTTGCVATDQGANRNAIVIAPVNTDVPSGGDLIEIDSYDFVDELSERDIKEITQKLGLAPLSKTARPEEFEFRIWTNLGGDAKLLNVRSSGSENNAYFFETNSRSDPIRFRREHLASPKSSWNKMLFEVRSRLTTPKGLVRDPNFDLDRDEPVILLEVLDKGEYRRVFYGKKTTFPDGKRLIEVCDYLASEFDVSLDCHWPRN
jgi:hypothetical protein